MKDSSIYVDTVALEEWGTKMESINSAAEESLNQFLEQVKQLEGAWSGSSATAYQNNTDTLITKAKECHENMSDVHRFLDEVVAVMEKE